MIRLGIVGCSEIAFRRFMPAAKLVSDIQVVAVAEEFAPEKLDAFCAEYGIEGMTSFEKLIQREDIDAIYVPQPPALHFKWAKYALECGKHVLIEKPSTTSSELTKQLIDIAKAKNLALHENYMFQYHRQIQVIKEIIESGRIGEIRLIRASFGFPLRASNDFRYVEKLGGGAIMDAAGYPVKLATLLLGKDIKVDSAYVNSLDGYEVDMFGSATLSNSDGVVCQIGYGMDSAYQCMLEVWGSKAKLVADRIFTPPETFAPVLSIEANGEKDLVNVEADSHFKHSIEMFVNQINDDSLKNKSYDDILLQATLVDAIKNA